jgi:hypothetical protein
MESSRSGETQHSASNKWLLGVLIVLLVLAVILAIWLYLGWLITKIVIGVVYFIFEMFAAPFSR